MLALRSREPLAYRLRPPDKAVRAILITLKLKNSMSQMGLGCAKTLGEKRRSAAFAMGCKNHALIAAISGWMPMMFMTRVRL
jgi:hypothetical protein